MKKRLALGSGSFTICIMNIRIVSCVFLSLALIGCGSSTTDGGDGSQRFGIGEMKWQLEIPENWEQEVVGEGSDAIILAHRADENFVIIRQSSEESDSVRAFNAMRASAAEDLFWFEALTADEDDLTWSFRAKLSPTSPLQEFQQKIFFLPGTNEFLLGSCAFEVAFSAGSECEDILDSWKISVDKEAKDA